MSKPKPPEIAVIRTRLAPPRVGNAPVNRDKVLLRLNAQRDCKLSLVLGPAGSGKTMVLAQWRKQLSEQGARVAWFNLSIDDDVTQVGAYLVESLRTAKLDVRDDELLLFNRSGGKSRNSFLASLVDDLIDCPDDIYLIIDDLHHSTAFSILQLLDALLDVLPSNVHLVFGSRVRPLLNLAKLQAQNQLAEVDFRDLRFDVEETSKFVAAQGLTSLLPEHIDRLHEMCEGWVAGLQLLLFSLRKEGQVERFFERHALKPALSQEAALASYLDSNVAERIGAEELDFLCSISVCRRFSASLCEELTGNPHAREILKKIEAEQLFLLPIDTPDVDTWYRFHRLFETFLHSRLERKGKSEIQRLNQAAAHWFAGQRLYVEALRYAGEAGDSELVVDLIDRSARRMSAEGHFRQLIKWCERVPVESFDRRLNIRLNLAWAQISCGQFDDFHENIKAILLLPEHQEASVYFEVQLLRAYGCSANDDSIGLVEIVEPMLQNSLPADAFLLSQISALALTGYVFAGRFALGREAIRIFHKHLPQGQLQHQNYLADAMVGSSYLTEGRVRDALAHLIPFRDQIVFRGKVGPDVLGNLIGTLCEALSDFNLLDEARQLSETYSEMVDAAGLPIGILSGYRARARLEFLSGRVQDAYKTLQRLEQIGLQRRLDRLVAWSLYEQFVLATHSHHLTSREEIAFRLSKLAEKYSSYERCALAEVPMLHALAAVEGALHAKAGAPACMERIEAAEKHCRELGRGSMLIRLGFMRCIVLLDSGKQAQALSAASDLLCRAEELGALRALADLGEIAHPLVKIVGARERSDAARVVLDVVKLDGRTDAHSGTEAAKALIEPLTERERAVLEHLGKGQSAKSIARLLDISTATARWHLHNTYGKLGANSREEALSKARQYRIIS